LASDGKSPPTEGTPPAPQGDSLTTEEANKTDHQKIEAMKEEPDKEATPPSTDDKTEKGVTDEAVSLILFGAHRNILL